ncbi:MAG: hypothetical protein RRX95_06605 [Oscillospiraceae bacterium]
MPTKERIIRELEGSAKKFKNLRLKFKGSKKFFAALDELHKEGIIEEVNGFVRLVKKPASSNDNLSMADFGDLEGDDIEIEEIMDEERIKPSSDLLKGTVVKLTENFGFVRVPDMAKDIFVAGKFMMGAVVGDEVEFKKLPSERHDFEGQIVAITKEKTGIVASVEKRMGKTFVSLRDCPTLSLPADNNPQAKQDDVVLVNLSGRGRGHRSLSATITTVIGKISSSKKAVELILAEKGVSRAV